MQNRSRQNKKWSYCQNVCRDSGEIDFLFLCI